MLGFGLGTIFYVTLLLLNAVTILHERRFLAKCPYLCALVYLQ